MKTTLPFSTTHISSPLVWEWLPWLSFPLIIFLLFLSCYFPSFFWFLFSFLPLPSFYPLSSLNPSSATQLEIMLIATHSKVLNVLVDGWKSIYPSANEHLMWSPSYLKHSICKTEFTICFPRTERFLCYRSWWWQHHALFTKRYIFKFYPTTCSSQNKTTM